MKRQKKTPRRPPSQPSKPDDDDDRLTPEEERQVAFGIAQGKAGLTYGPFEKGGLSLPAFMKACEQHRRVSISIPEILFEHLRTEAKRFGMRPGELMATILQTHQFKDQERQLILLAIEGRAASRPPKRAPRSRGPGNQNR